MRFLSNQPPREFDVGRGTGIRLKDCGRVELAPDEQVTLVAEQGGEYDVVRKSWGFYATPSLNRRLPRFGLRGVLVKSPDGTFYVLLVERDKEAEFERYLRTQNERIVSWLDSTEALETLERRLTG